MIRKLVRQMLTAQVFSALTVSLCLLIDSVMIGRFIGDDGIASYGLANPLLLAIGAIGSLLAAGIQVVCSRSLGKGDQEETNAGYSSALVAGGGISLVFLLAALIFQGPMARAMGAVGNETLFQMTKGYIAGFSIGAPGSMGSLVLIPFLQMAGQSNLLIVAVLTMTVADIALDLLNVLVFHGGMFGMGLASAISYYMAMAVTAIYFCSKKCVFKFSLKKVTRKKIRELFTSGVPAGFSMASAVILVLLINRILIAMDPVNGGKTELAAFSVITSIGNVAQCINTGTGGVSLTLAGVFFNEEDRSSLKELIRLLCRYAVYMGLAMGILLLVFANQMVSLLIPEPGKTQDMAALGLRIYSAGLIPVCILSALKNAYQATGRIGMNIFTSLAEGAFFPVLAAFIFSRFMGSTGIWLYLVVGELLTLACIAIFTRKLTGKHLWQDDACLLLKSEFGVRPENLMEADIQSVEDVMSVAQEAEKFCLERSRNSRLGNHISLCIEEMAGNTILHGFTKDNKPHHLSVRILRKPKYWVVRFRDDCRAFDPVHYIPREGKDAVGIHLVLALAEEARYTYSMNLNNLALRLPADDEAPAEENLTNS